MKRVSRYEALSISFLVLFFSGCALAPVLRRPMTTVEQVKQQIHLKKEGVILTAGAAKVEITPPVGTPLAGYTKRQGKPSVGIRDPLFVRALALSDGEDLILLISTDLLIFPQPLADEIRGELARELKIPLQAIILAATHTHSGTGAIASGPLNELVFGRHDRETVKALKGRVLWAAQQAVTHRQTVEWAQGEEAGSLEGLLENRMKPGEGVDPTLSVLFFKTMDGKPLALFVHAAAHPTLMDSQDFRFSADYPGQLAQALEESYPGAVCLFANGASGDVRPRDAIGSSSDERVSRFGKAVAEVAQSVISRLEFKEKADLAAWGWRMRLPPPQLHLGVVPLHPVIGRFIRPQPVVWINLVSFDGILLAALPAEPTSALGLELKRQLAQQGKDGILISYANGYQGYAVTPREYRRRSYEAWMTWYGPHFGTLLNEKFLELAGLYPGRVEPSGSLPVVYLSGSPYEMGYQHGAFFRKEVRASVANAIAFVDRHGKVPWVGRWIARQMLDRTWRQMKPYIPPRYLQELQGLSDGAGIPLKTLERLHALPELTATTCASFAAFGKATDGGGLIQIRNLDWAIQSDVQKHAALFVHQPASGRPFINVGWFGFIGVISGINEEGISVAEIGAETVDVSFKGIPMPFLLRWILEEGRDLKKAVEIVQTSPRTVGYNYLFADAKAKQAVALETTHRHCAVFWGTESVQSPEHLVVPDALFRSDLAFDPQIRDLQLACRGDPKRPGLESPKGSSAYEVRYRKQGELLLRFHRQINAETAMAIARNIAPSSNMQSIVYAYPQIWVAIADGRQPAAEGRYLYLDLKELFESSRRRTSGGH